VVFVIRSVVLHWLDKDITSYKAKLQAAAVEHQVRFTKLHEKRAEIISELYSKLDEAHRALRSFMNPIQWVNDLPTSEKEEIAEKGTNDLIRYYSPNKIWLPEDTCALIEEIIKQIHDAWHTYQVYAKNWSSTSQEARPDTKKWITSFEIVSEKIPVIRKELEIEFRKLLGVRKAQM
jgi:DNA phosphorothioation-dependent restriction protein DptG